MEEIFVARQPIYNRALEVTGYELLFRDAISDSVNITDGTQASSRLIINTFMSIGLENIVGSQPAFINLTDGFFLDDQTIPMTQEQVVLEIPVHSLNSDAVIKGVLELAHAGYAISLDDFAYAPELVGVLDAASYVKLNLIMFDEQALRQQYAQCIKHNVKVLAKKVEKQEQLAICRDIGFDGYQGYFFCEPDIIKGRSDGCNRGVLLNIVNRLQDTDATMEEMGDVITQDVELSYKLLRYINCANYALRREIDSVKEALVMIGIEQVKKWAVLILMSNYNSDKPRELSTHSMVRAQMCETLAGKTSNLNPQQAFTAGLFSTLDAVMDTPMEELLDTISLSTPIKFALLNFEGELGQLLQQVVSYEKGKWSSLDTRTLSQSDYAESYLDAVQWADNNRSLLS